MLKFFFLIKWFKYLLQEFRIRKNSLFILIFSFYIISFKVFSQSNINQGNLYIQNYNDKNYVTPENQTWAIVQDHRGVMYFGNNDGLLEFDGTNWRLIEITNKSIVRSLAIDSMGKIYVGAVGEFGYLQADSTGTMQFVSLLEKIPEEECDFEDVWEIFATGENIIVKTSNKIFLIKNNKTKVFKSEYGFHVSFLVNNNYFVKEREVGLLELINDSLQLVLNGNQFAKEFIYLMLPYQEDKILIATRKHGIFIYANALGVSKPQRFEEVNNFLMENQVYCGAKLNNEQFVFGTLQDGLIIINKNGKIVKHINEKSGLYDKMILTIYIDIQKNIWAGLNNGISYIIINSPFTLFNEKNGLNGTVYTAKLYKNRLYAGTSLGFFRKNKQNNFTKFENAKGQSWHLDEIQNELFLGHAEGVFLIKENIIKNISPNIGTIWTLNKLKDQPAGRQDKPFILAGYNKGLILLENKKGNWTFKHKIEGFNESSHWVQEDADGNIWVSHEFKGIYQLKLNESLDSVVKLDFYNSNYGLPANTHNFVFKIKTANQTTRILFGTEKGIYKFNPETNRFIPDETFNKLFDEEKLIDKFVQDANGNIYYQHGGEKGVLLFQNNNTYKIERTPFFKLKGLYIENICIIDSANIFFCSKDGIIDYHTQYTHDYNTSYYSAIIRQVLVNDSLVYGGSGNMANIIQLPYKQNNLQFYFSALYYEDHDKTQYSYFLEGFDKNWSEWSLKTDKEYTNLREGNYIFHVKAKNIYEKESSIVQYQFEILTPWYRTIIAYIIYSISTLFLVWLIVIFYTRKLKKEKDELEKIVIERTKDLHDVNTQLEEKQADLEIKQEEIEAQAEHLACVNKELEKLSIVASKTDNAVIIMDAQGKFKWINEGFTRMYGYKFENLIQEVGDNIINTSSNEKIKNIFENVTVNKKTVIYESNIKTKHGKEVWTQTTLTPILNNQNEIIHLIAIDSDITIIKLAEFEKEKQKQEIEKQRDELQVLNATKDKFFSIISHDLKAPFNTILGFANLLIQNAKNNKFNYEKNLMYAELVFDSANIAFSLLENLLTWSRSQRGIIEFKPAMFDIKIFVEQTILIYQNAALGKGINLSSAINENINVFADQNMINTVLRNLISNAIKFCNKNDKIQVDAQVKQKHIIISVSDTGVGIAENIIKKLFKVDENIKTEGTANEMGTGLGLILCKEFVEKNGGKIWVESIVGKGSTFLFTLPKKNNT